MGIPRSSVIISTKRALKWGAGVRVIHRMMNPEEDVTLELAQRGTTRHQDAFEMARRHWPEDPPSGAEIEIMVAVHRATNRVIGAVSLDLESDVPVPPPAGGPWIVNLVVAPDCRGQGIGTRLLRRAAERWAPAWFQCRPELLRWYAARVHLRVEERRPGTVVCRLLASREI